MPEIYKCPICNSECLQLEENKRNYDDSDYEYNNLSGFCCKCSNDIPGYCDTCMCCVADSLEGHLKISDDLITKIVNCL
jgi:hypothetical protein